MSNRAGEGVEDENRSARLAMVRQLKALRDSIRKESGEMPDSTPIIRAERDQRG